MNTTEFTESLDLARLTTEHARRGRSGMTPERARALRAVATFALETALDFTVHELMKVELEAIVERDLRDKLNAKRARLVRAKGAA